MVDSPRQYYPHTDLIHIDELLCEAQDKHNLSQWENEFLEDLLKSKKSIVGLGGLTQPQYTKLKEISEKEDDFEVW